MSSNSSSTNAPSGTNTKWYNWGATAAGVGSVALFITSFVLISSFAGGSEQIETIKNEVLTKIWPITLVGSFLLFIALALYVIQDPNRTMYIVLGLSCLSLSLSYSALAVSVISKK